MQEDKSNYFRKLKSNIESEKTKEKENLEKTNKVQLDKIQKEFEDEIKDLRNQLKIQKDKETKSLQDKLKKDLEENEGSIKKNHNDQLDAIRENLQKEMEKVLIFIVIVTKSSKLESLNTHNYLKKKKFSTIQIV